MAHPVLSPDMRLRFREGNGEVWDLLIEEISSPEYDDLYTAVTSRDLLIRGCWQRIATYKSKAQRIIEAIRGD